MLEAYEQKQIRGLRTKTNEFYNNCLASNFDVIVLTETWLHAGISAMELFGDAYHVYRHDRNSENPSVRGGGVLVAIHSNLTTSYLDPFTYHQHLISQLIPTYFTILRS
ncbi:hypothetical protein QE152_g1965 [Popillia japonica]|uniref:Uncharacterized protein n=1 Tax=Popillia japonica TaxID=7064 RepID=A0AAW1N4N0_POPJA